jgi:hypothetical protein
VGSNGLGQQPSEIENVAQRNLPAVVSKMSYTMDRTIRKAPVIHSRSSTAAKPLGNIQWMSFWKYVRIGKKWRYCKPAIGKNGKSNPIG